MIPASLQYKLNYIQKQLLLYFKKPPKQKFIQIPPKTHWRTQEPGKCLTHVLLCGDKQVSGVWRTMKVRGGSSCRAAVGNSQQVTQQLLSRCRWVTMCRIALPLQAERSQRNTVNTGCHPQGCHALGQLQKNNRTGNEHGKCTGQNEQTSRIWGININTYRSFEGCKDPEEWNISGMAHTVDFSVVLK